MSPRIDAWIQLVAGIWILVSPWVLGFGAFPFMKWSNAVVGALLIVLNVWHLFGNSDA